MKFSISEFDGATIPKAVAAKFRTYMAFILFAVCSHSAYGFTLTATASTPNISCNTATGPGTAVSILIKPTVALTSSNTVTVLLSAPSGGIATITTPGSQVLTAANSVAGITYVVNYVAGCVGATAGTTTKVLQFNTVANNTTTADVTSSLSAVVTAATSALAPSSVPVTPAPFVPWRLHPTAVSPRPAPTAPRACGTNAARRLPLWAKRRGRCTPSPFQRMARRSPRPARTGRFISMMSRPGKNVQWRKGTRDRYLLRRSSLKARRWPPPAPTERYDYGTSSPLANWPR